MKEKEAREIVKAYRPKIGRNVGEMSVYEALLRAESFLEGLEQGRKEAGKSDKDFMLAADATEKRR